jgi:muramidase (phage lysozyme)
MRIARVRVISAIILSQFIVACGGGPDGEAADTQGFKMTPTGPSTMSRQLWSSVSKPARQMAFEAKDASVKVWIGSVRTRNYSDGTVITPAERAFLDVIAAAEGTSFVGRSQCGSHSGYESIQGCYAVSDGSGLITPSEMRDGHPDRSIGGSYAAGRYQFLPLSFAEVTRMTNSHRWPIDDFSPVSQDRAALLAIKWKRADEKVARAGDISPHEALLKLDALIKKNRGNFAEAHWKIFEGILDALSPEWASFPVLGTSRSFYEPQPAQKAIQLWQVFKASYKIYLDESKVKVAAK